MKISDISIEISAKYQISATIEAKSVMKIRLREKSLKNRKFRRYIGIGPKFRRVKHTRVWVIFMLQNIEDISEISVKYRGYIGNIGENIGDISGYIGNISK